MQRFIFGFFFVCVVAVSVMFGLVMKVSSRLILVRDGTDKYTRILALLSYPVRVYSMRLSGMRLELIRSDSSSVDGML